MPVAVEIGDGYAVGRLGKGGRRQVCADLAAELERHPIGIGEFQIGNGLACLGGAPDRFGKAGFVERGKLGETVTPARGDVRRRAIGAEKAVLAILIKRHQSREPARDPGVTGKRFVLGLRQFKPLLQGRDRSRDRRGAQPIVGETCRAPCHRIAV